jgi:hypothetical protein
VAVPDDAHHAHRASAARRSRVVAGLGAGVLALVVAAGVLAVVRLGDDGPARAADLSGLTAPTDVVVRSAGTPRARSARERAASPAAPGAADPADPADPAAQRRLETAVSERSAALEDLLARAEKKARQEARAVRKAEKAVSGAPFSVAVGSFNVLGSQHTVPGGDRASWPPASVRSVGAANLIAKHGVDIVGTQELQDDQLRALQARTGMAAYPGFAWGVEETDNSILYDEGRFELVSGDRFIIPFMGRPRPQPIVRLRERTTGREFYVVNTHPSAHDGPYLAERRQGQATLVAVVNDLKQSGLPVLVTGDMNDREIFYCNVVPQSGLTAPNGGSYASGCQPPPQPLPVDWVVGSGVTWSGYWRDTSPLVTRISNHFFISATATFG